MQCAEIFRQALYLTLISYNKLSSLSSKSDLIFQVRAIYDVKGIDMGNNFVRYKAENDFDGRELTRSYLDKHDLNVMLEVRLSIFIFFYYDLKINLS